MRSILKWLLIITLSLVGVMGLYVTWNVSTRDSLPRRAAAFEHNYSISLNEFLFSAEGIPFIPVTGAVHIFYPGFDDDSTDSDPYPYGWQYVTEPWVFARVSKRFVSGYPGSRITSRIYFISLDPTTIVTNQQEQLAVLNHLIDEMDPEIRASFDSLDQIDGPYTNGNCFASRFVDGRTSVRASVVIYAPSAPGDNLPRRYPGTEVGGMPTDDCFYRAVANHHGVSGIWQMENDILRGGTALIYEPSRTANLIALPYSMGIPFGTTNLDQIDRLETE